MRFQNSRRNHLFFVQIVMLPLLFMALYPPTATNTLIQPPTITPSPVSFTKLTGHTKNILKIVFSPNGQFIASSSDDKTVRLWELQTGKEIRQFIGHSESVNDVSFSIDGKLMQAMIKRPVFGMLKRANS